ncbi:MAG: hypothetical protein KDA24_18415 [Deltaproteobacteria bacterium]|nr:hypothetical protein [Deltaproteobacteria bacterium]
MTAEPVITALGLLTPLAVGREAFAEAWRAGASATPIAEGPTAGGYAVPKFILRKAFPEGRALMRRMDRLSKMICMAGALARDDAPGLGDVQGMAMGVGTDLGTLEMTWAFLCRLRDKGPELANPNDFPNLVPNAGAGYLGILMGARGPSHTFCQHSTCADDAIAWAADGVLAGWFEAGLAGGAEELGPIRAKAMERAGCPITEGPAGEGGTMVLVESRTRAEGRGVTPLATWRGSWGASGLRKGSPLKREVDPDAVAELVKLAVAKSGAGDIGVALLSREDDPALVEGLRRGLGRDVPLTDHGARCGIHPADGALRAALASMLLSDESLPVNRGGEARSGPAALLLSAGRGGGLRVSVLSEA